MKAKTASERRHKKWQALVKEWEESGEGVVSFCQRKGFTRHSFSYWRKRVKKIVSCEKKSSRKKRSSKPQESFIPVHIVSSTTRTSGLDLKVELRGGRILWLNSELPSEALERIFQALEGSL